MVSRNDFFRRSRFLRAYRREVFERIEIKRLKRLFKLREVNISVLLADDDLDDAELFQEALVQINASIEFRHARSGTEVLSILETLKPDVIFLDLNMPQMDGWQCLARLKSNSMHARIPVIIYTTSNFYKDKEKATQLGADGLITKPTDFHTLKFILSQVIANLHSDLKATLRGLSGS